MFFFYFLYIYLYIHFTYGGSLIGMNIDNSLVSINYKTGKQTKISKKLDSYTSAQQLSTIDNDNNILYSIIEDGNDGQTKLLGLDVVNNGSITTLLTIPNLEFQGIAGIGQSIQYKNNSIYMIAFDTIKGDDYRAFIKINLLTNKTNTINYIKNTPNISTIFGAISGIDDDYFYYQIFNDLDNGTYLEQINLINGNVDHILNLTSIGIQTMNYDYINKQFIGLNLSNDQLSRSITYFTNDLQFKIGTKLNTNLIVLSGSMQALSSKNRLLFTYFGKNKYIWDLLVINCDTSQIYNTINFIQIPFHLHYFDNL